MPPPPAPASPAPPGEIDFEIFHQIRLRLTALCGDPYLLHTEAIDKIEADLAALRRELADTRAERDKLQAFKDWTHRYLDSHGVPHHPLGTHGAEGCRIGDRMDWLMGQLADTRERERRLIEELRFHKTLHHISEWHEDQGTVLWWYHELGEHAEPNHVGSPLDTDWEEYAKECREWWSTIPVEHGPWDTASRAAATRVRS